MSAASSNASSSYDIKSADLALVALLTACASTQEKEAQTAKEEQAHKALDELNRQVRSQSDMANASAKQAAQSQKAIEELNKQLKDQSDMLTTTLSKAVPDAGAAQRAEAAKEAERRKAVETNISKTPDWFLQNDNNHNDDDVNLDDNDNNKNGDYNLVLFHNKQP